MADEWAFVALGSNLGDSTSILERASADIQLLTDAPLRRSSIVLTDPVDCPPGSPPFRNAVLALQPRPAETPLTLLAQLQAIERKYGRQQQSLRNAPRPLDLDLIAFGFRRESSPQLTLPHPRAHLRRFVLQPLSEIAPDLVLPGQSQTVAALLRSLP